MEKRNKIIFIMLVLGMSFIAFAARRPVVGGDLDNWGTIENEWSLMQHNGSGEHVNLTTNTIVIGGGNVSGAEILDVRGNANISGFINASQVLVYSTDITLNLSRLNESATRLWTQQTTDNDTLTRLKANLSDLNNVNTTLSLNLSRLNQSTTLLWAQQVADNASIVRTDRFNLITGGINATGTLNATILQLVTGGTLLLPGNSITNAMINSLDATKITSGIFAQARFPNRALTNETNTFSATQFVTGGLNATTFLNATTIQNPTFTSGSVVFAGTNGILAQDNANLFWDDSANRLGINTTTPTQTLTVVGQLNVTGGDSSVVGLFVNTTGKLGIGTSNVTESLKIVGSGKQRIRLEPSPVDISSVDFIRIGSASRDWRLENAGDFFFKTAVDDSFDTVTTVLDVGATYLIPGSANAIDLGISGNEWRDLFVARNATISGLNVDSGTLFVSSPLDRVGINTTTPTQTLTVVGTANITGGASSVIGLVVTGNGRVGVGKAVPDSKFDVSGTMRNDDVFTSTGSITIDSSSSPKQTIKNTATNQIGLRFTGSGGKNVDLGFVKGNSNFYIVPTDTSVLSVVFDGINIAFDNGGGFRGNLLPATSATYSVGTDGTKGTSRNEWDYSIVSNYSRINGSTGYGDILIGGRGMYANLFANRDGKDVIVTTGYGSSYVKVDATNGGSRVVLGTSADNNQIATERLVVSSTGNIGINVSNVADTFGANDRVLSIRAGTDTTTNRFAAIEIAGTASATTQDVAYMEFLGNAGATRLGNFVVAHDGATNSGKFTIGTFSAGSFNEVLSLRANQTARLAGYAGTGRDYACFDANGFLVRSDAAC